MVAWSAEVVPEPVESGSGNVLPFRPRARPDSDAVAQPLLSIPLGA